MLRARANGEAFVSATMCPQQCVLVCQGLKYSKVEILPQKEAQFGVYVGVKTCELFLCFVAIVRVRVYCCVTAECNRFLHRRMSRNLRKLILSECSAEDRGFCWYFSDYVACDLVFRKVSDAHQ